MAILPLAACGGGGGGGAPATNTPAPPPNPTPQTGSFSLVATDTYLATNDLNSTFSQPASNNDLRVIGRGGNDTITSGRGNDNLEGGDGNDTINAGTGDDTVRGGAGADTLNGGAGWDWLAYDTSNSSVNVNLLTGVTSGGDAQNDTILNFERVAGSRFGDIITGDNENNFLEGLGGADQLDGGDGVDFATYYNASGGIIANLNTGVGSQNDASGDIYTNIEGVIGSEFNDTITGDNNNNELLGQGGNDTINGLDGSDIITGGAGSDVMDGGDGFDYLAYYYSTSGVTVNLDSGSASGGSAQGDTFSNFESILGSNFADTLTGDANDNTLSGLGGIDVLNGGAGDDIFVAFQSDNSENDTFNGGDDYDLINFVGDDTSSTYTINLASINATDIESVRMGNDYREALTLTAQDVIDVTDAGNTLQIIGHDTDSVNSSSTWNYVQDVMVRTEIYHQYTSGAATVNIHVETGSLTGFAKPAASFTETASNTFEAIDNNNSTFSDTVTDIGLTVTGKDGDDLIVTNTGNDIIIGGAGNDSLDGNGGDDQIDGGTGADIIFGGSGDDTFIFDVLDTFDGGSGADTLNVSGTGANIDLSTVDAIDMEIIDLTGSGNNQITLVLQDVLDVTDDNNRIIFDGDTGDQVTSAGQGWIQGADEVIGSETYNTYTAGGATLLVDEDITQVIS